MEPIVLGKLTFEQLQDDDEAVIVVRREQGGDTYAEYRRCKDDVKEWNYLKKNCWPMNGVGEKPPVGKWVLYEYIGNEHSSGNQMPSKADEGFTERELLQLTVAVNAAFGEPDAPPLAIPVRRRRRVRKEEEL